MFKTMPWGLILCLMSSVTCHAQSLNYHFHWGYIPLADLSMTLQTRQLAGDTTEREIRFEGSTIGAVGKFLEYDGLARSVARPDSLMYSMSGTDNGFDEHRQIYFPTNAAPQVISFRDDETQAPSQQQLLQVGPAIDPLALIQSLMASPLGSGCNGEFRVFDGKRLMQISAQAMGMEAIEADRSWAWAGQALRCDMQITSFEMTAEVTHTEAADQKAAWLQGNPEVRTIWLAEVNVPGAGAQIRPVRFSIPGPIGRVKGRLVAP